MSAADRWGLLGLLAMIKNADPDQALLSVGTDLGTMGLDMQQQGCVPQTFLLRADMSFQESIFNIHHALGRFECCTYRRAGFSFTRMLQRSATPARARKGCGVQR